MLVKGRDCMLYARHSESFDVSVRIESASCSWWLETSLILKVLV